MPLPTRKRQTKIPMALPKDFLQTVGNLFKKQFKKQVGEAAFLVYGDLYTDEVIFCASLAHPKSLRAASLHISTDLVDAAEHPEKVTEKLKSMVDVAASWFSQCLQGGGGLEAAIAEIAQMSPNWQEFAWEGQSFFVKLNRDNYALEKAADNFLKSAGFDPADDDADIDALFNEEDGDDDSNGPLH